MLKEEMNQAALHISVRDPGDRCYFTLLATTGGHWYPSLNRDGDLLRHGRACLAPSPAQNRWSFR